MTRQGRTWAVASRIAAVAVVVALVGVAAACGGEREASDGPSADGGGATTAAPAASGGDRAAFGDLPSPCRPGDPSGAPDQGVDDATVTIGYGDDAGFQGNPGANHQMSDAVRALIDWCNEQGGINGREVVGTYYDARITEVTNVMTEACDQVFMLVGEGFSLAGTAEQTRLGCGLPAVPGILGGSDVANAPLMVSPAPQPVDYFNVQGAAALADAFPEAVTKAGIMLPDFPATVDLAEKATGTFPSVGWQFLDCTQRYPITGVTDFRPYLQKLADCGAEVVFTPDAAANLENQLDAAHQLEFEPIWMVTSTVYDENFANWNQNGNADQVYFGNAFVPLADTTPGTANAVYVELVTGSGGDVSYLGQQAASAFLLWATAADACGDELTRECVMQELAGVHDWTAGGLSSPQDPGGNLPGECGLVLKVEGTGFVQWQPEAVGEFACDPSYLAQVDPPIATAGVLELDGERVAHRNEPG